MSERERLLGRKLPPVQVPLRIDFTPEADAAYAAAESALRALSAGEARGADPDELASLRQAVDATRGAYERHCLVLKVKALPPEEYEQLELDHPPTDEQAADGMSWDPTTYVPALLAACVEGDMTAEDWTEMRRRPGLAAAGELNMLAQRCIVANDRSPDLLLGKG